MKRQVKMNSLRRLLRNVPVLRVGGDLGGSSATMAGLTGFLCAGRMESVGKEIWPESGREGYRS
jgi:hypothetical protein